MRKRDRKTRSGNKTGRYALPPRLKPCIGFRYTDKDILDMAKAIEQAIEFFETYGKATDF